MLRAILAVSALLLFTACTSSSSPAFSPSPSSSPSAPSPSPGAPAAAAAALATFVMIPPSPVWSGCPQAAADFAACPFSPTLVSRLQALSTSGYFSSTPPGVCAEDYITGTQNGLSQDPTVLSSTLNADGTVSVVIRRGLPPPDLTLTMSDTTGAWLAVDLASGAGASASVFSTHPNC